VFVCLAVVFLLTGHRYIGVAWASVVSAFVTALLLWWRLLSTKELSWEGWPSRAIRRQTWHGTGKVLLGGFGGYLGGRIDNLLVSASIGPAAMSFYSMAWNASRTPANVFAKAITFVLVPAVARIQDDPARLQRALRECLRNSYLVLTPVCALLFVTAPLLVSYVIGPKWLPLVPALRVMCFTVLCGPMLFALGAFLTGIGRAHLVGIANVIQIVLLLGGIPFFATRWGVLGAAFGDLLAVFVLTLALFVTTRIATGLPNGKLVATVLLPVVAAIAAGSLAWGVGAYIVDDLTRLLSEVALVSIGYLLAVLAFGGRGRLFDLSALLRDIYALPGAGQPAVKGKMNISSQRQNLTVRAAAWYLRDFPVTRGKGWVNRILGKFIIVKVFDGTKLRLINPLEYHQKPLLFGEEEYEPQIVSLLANALGPGKVFFDVGANMGYHSLLASKIVGSEGRVHAFEPSPAQFKHLKLNVGINQAGNVVLNNSAVAESSEDRELYISVGWNQGTHSLRRTADQGESCRVGCVSIDDYVEKSGIKRIDAIKVDVEGAELFVFKGAQRVLGSMPPPLLVFESCEGFSQSFAYSTRDAKQMIAQYGYALYNIELGPEPVQVSSSSIERYANIVAIHSSADDCYNRALYTACKSGGVGIVGKGLVR
jgi:FkbM family methyltransferase